MNNSPANLNARVAEAGTNKAYDNVMPTAHTHLVGSLFPKEPLSDFATTIPALFIPQK